MPDTGAPVAVWTRHTLAQALQDARRRTLELVEDLDDAQLRGPRLAIVNPLLWEIGHVAWFHERWVLRHLRGRPPLLREADRLYDSIAIAHDTRWDLPLPSREQTLAYMSAVLEAILEELARAPGELAPSELQVHLLALYHEDMHGEAFAYTRQTLGYPPPGFARETPRPQEGGPLAADAEFPGGTYVLGPRGDEPFVFDNELEPHEVRLEAFAIARAATTQGQFLAFVEDGGYLRREFWSEEGWAWRERERATHPVYWRREGTRWYRRVFDRWVPLEPQRPVIHVNAYEAEAYCRWAKRRLPTEAEWEYAASLAGGYAKRLYPWGDAPPDPRRANLDGIAGGTLDVGALAAGDTPGGLRQMLGNVWEWTASVFRPYPGFRPGLYREYSEPWFGTHRVLRGGCWVTRSRMIRNAYRNYYTPERRDVWAGFRTCAC